MKKNERQAVLDIYHEYKVAGLKWRNIAENSSDADDRSAAIDMVNSIGCQLSALSDVLDALGIYEEV